jgi:hypothetical protein
VPRSIPMIFAIVDLHEVGRPIARPAPTSFYKNSNYTLL